MKKVLVLFFILNLLGGTASAFFLFEPYIGYNRGQHQASRTQGLGYGARIGVEMGALFIAGDITMSELQQAALATKYSDTALVFGGELGGGFRVWYGQIVSTQFTYKSGVNDVAYKGSGMKIGAGSRLGSKTNLNLEIKTYDYTESSTAGVSTPVAEVGTLGFLSFSWVF